jgi:hypothetical protein
VVDRHDFEEGNVGVTALVTDLARLRRRGWVLLCRPRTIDVGDDAYRLRGAGLGELARVAKSYGASCLAANEAARTLPSSAHINTSRRKAREVRGSGTRVIFSHDATEACGLVTRQLAKKATYEKRLGGGGKETRAQDCGAIKLSALRTSNARRAGSF